MEILITNDDGWGSKGLTTLIQAMRSLGHITVVAPEGPRSGRSMSISVATPMYLTRRTNLETEWEGVTIYTTNGTPADCIKLAMNAIYDGDPTKVDLVVSGINHGHNASANLLYSGTMGACFVACENQIKAIGFSLNDDKPDADFHFMAPYIPQIVTHLLDEGFGKNLCYNVNAPVGEIQGIQWTRQCAGHWEKELEPHTDAEGRTYYILVGDFINHEPEATDTDLWALDHNYLSIQPVSIDLTAYDAL